MRQEAPSWLVWLMKARTPGWASRIPRTPVDGEQVSVASTEGADGDPVGENDKGRAQVI